MAPLRRSFIASLRGAFLDAVYDCIGNVYSDWALSTHAHTDTLCHTGFRTRSKPRRSQTICRLSSSICKHNYDITRTHTLTDANFPRAARHPLKHAHTQTDNRQRTTTTADAAPLARRCRPTDACAMLPTRRVCRPTLSYARVCVRPSAKNTLTHNAHTHSHTPSPSDGSIGVKTTRGVGGVGGFGGGGGGVCGTPHQQNIVAQTTQTLAGLMYNVQEYSARARTHTHIHSHSHIHGYMVAARVRESRSYIRHDVTALSGWMGTHVHATHRPQLGCRTG